LQGIPDQGIGKGLSGSQVVHVEAPVLGTRWLLIRERDVGELMEMLDRPLMVNDIFLGLFILLVMGVVMSVWRTAHLLRENDKATLRGNFVSSVSHELRTPLTQIRMYAEMLRSGLLREPAESERALRVIEKEASRLSLLVDRTLDFTRSKEALRVEPVPPTDVGEAVRAAAAAFAPLAAERRADVQIDVPDGVFARIDAGELQQVLLNLLDNAVKYGPRGQTIGISAREDGTATRICVEDEGPGVPVAERDAIFGAFARGKAAKGSRESGSGIGLSVVRNLVEQFGGRAYVEARRNGGGETVAGARFVIELRSPRSG
jgi:signal transduction histidine kinase